MIVSLFVGLIVCAVFLLYCSNKHQQLRAKPLPKYFKWLGMLFITGALYIATLQFSGVAGLVSWLMITMLCLVILPSVVFFSKVQK
ncbi:hypothetical protein PCIT_a2024 [Pseudoalteromonas citrea]|uniref:DUF3325 domain-containing protein n=2 Tax=Pseudoalteromonas citrea TaxID=43655 RepID=A0AAD4AJ50_9GAMM|nr:hypothetical protein PCIT_a2024 [Pseudoalteromonas citrea]